MIARDIHAVGRAPGWISRNRLLRDGIHVPRETFTIHTDAVTRNCTGFSPHFLPSD